MNFNQWLGHAAKQDVAKVTYCCGDQNTLIELVLEDIKSILNVPVTDYFTVDAEKDEEFWEVASQYPLYSSSNRLTVVRNAHAIKNWEELEEWIKHSRNNPRNYILFISNLSDAPSLYLKGKRVSYADHIELIRKKGNFIRCSKPNDEDLISWIKTCNLTDNSAQFLVDRTSSDVAAIYEVLQKVGVWDGSPSPKALSLLCQEQAQDSMADYLILRDKRSAYIALQNMSDEDKLKVITRLDHRLDMMLELGSCVRRRMYDGDIAASTGIKIFLVKKFKHVVKDYDEKKIKYCRQILTMLDGAIKDGAKTGTMESLIALW